MDKAKVIAKVQEKLKTDLSTKELSKFLTEGSIDIKKDNNKNVKIMLQSITPSGEITDQRGFWIIKGLAFYKGKKFETSKSIGSDNPIDASRVLIKYLLEEIPL